jgi:hypothetical protein
MTAIGMMVLCMIGNLIAKDPDNIMQTLGTRQILHAVCVVAVPRGSLFARAGTNQS